MKFQLSISACVLALLVLSSSAWATGEFEPNDTLSTAAGPLEGGKTYNASFETENDVDWYLFYVKTYSQMDFSATMTKACGYSAEIRLYDLDGKFVNSFYAGNLNQTNHLLFTLSPGRYYLEFLYPDCPQDAYSFRVDPAAAITANRECGEAIVSKESVGPQLAKVAGELSKNGEKLVKPTEEVNADEAALAALSKRWEAFLVKWKSAMRKLSRAPRLRGYVRRSRRRSLLATKRRTSLQLKAQKDSLKRRLASAVAAQAKVLEQRASLQAVETQGKSTLSQAEAQIVAHC